MDKPKKKLARPNTLEELNSILKSLRSKPLKARASKKLPLPGSTVSQTKKPKIEVVEPKEPITIYYFEQKPKKKPAKPVVAKGAKEAWKRAGFSDKSSYLIAQSKIHERGKVQSKQKKKPALESPVKGLLRAEPPKQPVPIGDRTSATYHLEPFGGGKIIFVWKNSKLHGDAMEIIQSGLNADKIKLLNSMVVCRVTKGTPVIVTDAGWITHDILITGGPNVGCRGNIPAEELIKDE